MPSDTLADFHEALVTVLTRKALEKGYSSTGPIENRLHIFMEDFFPNHALGEIVYKAIRFKQKGNKEDLIKIAAWAALIWLHTNDPKT